MRKGQGSVLGVVILTGVVLAIVSVTYVWGQPLIQKNLDKAKVNQVLEKLSEINDAVLYTAGTGSNSVVELDLSDSTFTIDPTNNRIVYETRSAVPIIASEEQVPINYYELAEERQNKMYNATMTGPAAHSLTDYKEGTVHYTNTSIGGTFYNVTTYQNSTGSWTLACFWNSTLIKSLDCASPGEAIQKEGETIDVLGIENNGREVYTIGEYVENKGVIGEEPSGIISGKALDLKDEQKLTFYLTYRTMLSSDKEEHTMILECNTDCVASNSQKELVITRHNMITTSNAVTTYIQLRLQ